MSSHSEPLFPPSLIPTSVISQLPEGYHMRPLALSDYHNNYLSVLRVLTVVGEISESAWTERYNWIKARNDEYFIVVITDGSGKCVATASLIIEKKFIRELSSVGHIEDVSVAADQQGKSLGKRLVQCLDALAEQAGCYKAILDCSEKNVPFYEKCGYKLAGIEMAHYYDGGKAKDAPKKIKADL